MYNSAKLQIILLQFLSRMMGLRSSRNSLLVLEQTRFNPPGRTGQNTPVMLRIVVLRMDLINVMTFRVPSVICSALC